MNMLKSFYPSPFMMGAMGIAIYSVYRLVATPLQLGFVGVLFTIVPFLFVIGRILMFQNIARTSDRMPVVLILGIVGLGIAVFDYVQGGAVERLPISLAIIGIIGFLLYDFWYSSFGRKPSPVLHIGEPLPDFELQDLDGNTVSTASMRTTPTVMLFYRGNWCPLCMAQIKEVVRDYKELEALGAQVVLVSPQPNDNTRALSDRFDVPFRFLVDQGNKAADQLGIAMEYGVPLGIIGYDSNTVMPTVIVTDATGKIILLDQTDNYRVRPEPSTFIAALQAAS